MTTLAWTLVAAAALFAFCDWWAVAARNKAVEYVCKPATMLALIAAALALEPDLPARRAWFVAALVLSLAGDVFLMLPRDRFVYGLGAFLVAHLLYIAGFRVGEASPWPLLLGAVLVFPVAAWVGLRILRAVRTTRPALATPVAAYMAVISVMVAAAFATLEPLAVVGAGLFYLSDALIGWTRFVHPLPWAPVAIIATYHTAQAALVLSLV